MPEWCQRNMVDWVRINGPDGWTVRVLDSNPDSPNYAVKYLPADLLPQAFVKGSMTGPYVGPHSSDFLRGACLQEHGGAYVDVGNIPIRSLDRICWRQLEDPKSPFQVAIPWMYGTITANHFVAARKGDPFIKRWYVQRFVLVPAEVQSIDVEIGTNCSSTSGKAVTTMLA